jgi:Ca-activated chloride channel homolog
VPGRHRRTFNTRGAGVVAAALAIIVIAAGSWLGYRRLSDTGCTGQIRLTVAAAPEITPAVTQAAQTWTASGANVKGTCVAVAVSAINPAQMAAAIAREHQVTLTGLGPAPASIRTADVWLPDSTTWLMRLQSEASGFVPTDGASVAQSPVVVGMPRPVAEQGLGWPDKKLTWADLLKRVKSDGTLRTGIVDPTRDAAGLSGLLALVQASGTGAGAGADTVATLRALAAGSSALRDDLVQKFPQALDANDIATGLSAAPLSEEDVVAYNAQRPTVPLAALYLEPAPLPLDYPFAVMPEVDLQKAAAASEFRQRLQQPDFKNMLATVGLRGPDGTVGAGFNMPVGAPQASAAAPDPSASADPASKGSAASGLDASAISQALGSWAAITLPGRVLAVFDVSGSMLTKVPTAGNLTRAQVTQRAAGQGLALFDDRWQVGVWLFSTELVGKQPWRELVPISPLTSARGILQNSIPKIVPKKDGDTGLYDTALAAYKNVQDSWQPGRVNSVLLFTDGQNDNPDGITRDQLIAQLKKLNDPKRPVRMIFIGIGREVDRGELEAIAGATSAGGVFTTEDPAKISEIFLEAISSRSGASR